MGQSFFVMKNYFLIFLVATIAISSCVPARKYQELEAKQKECAEELENIKSKVTGLESQNTELQGLIPDLQEGITRLKGDTTLLGKSLRMKEQQYDKINDLNMRIQEQLEALQKGSAIENAKLMNDLNATKLQLQLKEDELKKITAEAPFSLALSIFSDNKLETSKCGFSLFSRIASARSTIHGWPFSFKEGEDSALMDAAGELERGKKSTPALSALPFSFNSVSFDNSFPSLMVKC